MQHLKSNILTLISVIISFIIVSETNAQIKLSAIFSDNMVLQRDTKIPVWGTADSGDKILVQLGKKNITAVADENGKWNVDLPPFKAGGPYKLKISGKNDIVLNNIMIGEVWICSGQSNMALEVREIGDACDNNKEISEANFSNIRFFTVDPMTAAAPQSDLTGRGWEICDSNTVKRFSAAGYFFGKNLYKKLNIPIGLINSSYGGTDIEAWTSSQALKTIPYFNDILQSIKLYSENDTTFLKDYNIKREEWKSSSMNTDPGYPASGITWKDTTLDVGSWSKMNVPCLWYQDELKEFNGSVWYRKEIDIPSDWTGKELVLNMGPIDDIDVTWFNGQMLGSGELWDKPRQYIIPASLIKPGRNILAIRCIDTGGPGGVWGEADQYYISNSSNEKIPIAGEWYYKKTLPINGFPPRPTSFENPNCPTVLFNAMIAPLIPYSMRGVIWYQGENNTYTALRYRTLFPLMINDWRTKWAQGEFPFYFVQLANYMSVNQNPVEDTWAELREAQLMTLKVKNTGMASAIDIGDSVDIHPKNKRELGKRLALIALNKIYGKNVKFSGPIYKSYKVEKNRIRISFDFADGLKIKDGEKLKRFAIAGDDHKFVWADAKIEKNSVVVWNSAVPNPIAVRYAWASNPVCNLYNNAELPASPFRTDDWKVLTEDFEK